MTKSTLEVVFIKSLVAMILSLVIFEVCADESILMEACNSIEIKQARLDCFKELSALKKKNKPVNDAEQNVANAFSSLASVISSGVSYNNYTTLLIEPAKALGIFYTQQPKPDKRVVDLYNESLIAYHDAEKVWRASIYNTKDAGILFGKILNPQHAGLMDIVNKYELPTKMVLLNIHLPAENALQIIWQYANNRAVMAAGSLGESNSTTSIHDLLVDASMGNPSDQAVGEFFGLKLLTRDDGSIVVIKEQATLPWVSSLKPNDVIIDCHHYNNSDRPRPFNKIKDENLKINNLALICFDSSYDYLLLEVTNGDEKFTRKLWKTLDR